jgi:aminoglycoside phosphotransferase family enzyme/predicted kinase
MRALLDPRTYPHPADDIRLHETHVSWVVLAGQYAYKMKKPVDFGFLDFSTRARRATACADEVALNRRLCPDVYLGVARLVRQGQRYTVVTGRDGTVRRTAPCAGAGEASTRGEPLVWMRRLPESGMLPGLLERGAANRRLVSRLARHLARFHAAAATGPGVDEYAMPEQIEANWRENFDQTAGFPETVLPAALRRRIERYVTRFLAAERKFLADRVTAGRVRDGHGDLHAANVCVEGRRAHCFDCIEFAPRFRCADVAAEVAFLAMDLDHYGRADLSAAFVDAYAAASGDADAARLLDFYKCYRAYVRGKVLGLRLAERGLPAVERRRVAARARAYFDLAAAYAGAWPRPVVAMVMGLPASGKTTLAHALAGRLAMVHLSSDVARKELAGLRPYATPAGRDAPFGQGLYAPAMTRRTYAVLLRRAAVWLRRGRSAVLDATFGTPDERAAVRRLAARLDVPLVTVVCCVPDEVARRRLRARERRGTEASDARLALWPQLRRAFVHPDEMPGVAEIRTDTPLDDCVERVLAALGTAPKPGAATGARAGGSPNRSGVSGEVERDSGGGIVGAPGPEGLGPTQNR